MSSEDIFINGELLRVHRESRGWVLNDMATRACMSIKQIRQIEEGGLSAFYSMAVKVTAAKKVGALLGLTNAEVLAPPNAVRDHVPLEPVGVLVQESFDVLPDRLDDASSEICDAAVAHAKSSLGVFDSTIATAEAPEATKSRTSLWIIALLFGSALGVAAYMQPQEEPALESVPPLQVMPSEAPDPAIAASASESAVMSSEVVVIPASAAVTTTISSSSPVR